MLPYAVSAIAAELIVNCLCGDRCMLGVKMAVDSWG